jgi:hypothetical protein
MKRENMDDYSLCYSGERSDMVVVYMEKEDILLPYLNFSICVILLLYFRKFFKDFFIKQLKTKPFALR